MSENGPYWSLYGLVNMTVHLCCVLQCSKMSFAAEHKNTGVNDARRGTEKHMVFFPRNVRGTYLMQNSNSGHVTIYSDNAIPAYRMGHVVSTSKNICGSQTYIVHVISNYMCIFVVFTRSY